MSDHGQYKLWSIPGDGVLARQGNLVLLTSIEDRGFAESLLDLLTRTNEAGGDGRALADAIGAAVERHQSWGGSQVGPSIVAFGPAGSGLAFTVSGAAFVEISTSHGKHRLVAGHPSMLLRSMVAVSVLTVRGGLGGNGPGDRTDRFTRLDSGTVRAWGMSYSAPPDAPPAPAGTQPAGEPGQAPRVPVAPRAEAASPAQTAPPAQTASPAQTAPPVHAGPQVPAASQAHAASQAEPVAQGRGAPEAEAVTPFQAEPPAHVTPAAQAIPPDLAAPPPQARPPAQAPPQGQPAPQGQVEPPQGRTAPRPQQAPQADVAPPVRSAAQAGRPPAPPARDPSAQPPPHRRDQAPPVDPAALDSSGTGGRRPAEPDSPFGPSFEVEPPFLAEPFEAETPAGTGPYPDERAPFAEEHPPFPEERTPFGDERTPFGAQPPGHGFDEPASGERGGPEPDQDMAALYDLGLE